MELDKKLINGITSEEHKKLGVNLFNQACDLIDQKVRSSEEDEMMINAAHASLYHWRQVGDAVNFARSEWQVSRVYSLCNRAEPALHHPANCLRICENNNIGDFDLAFAYEALSRAMALEHRTEEMEQYRVKAESVNIQKKEDRDYFLTELATI